MTAEKPRVSMVALDLDDTLLAPDLTIPARSKEAIRRAWAAGIKVTIATGRTFASALPYAEELGLDLPLITYNGSLIKRAATGQELFRAGVPRDLAHRIVDLCEAERLALNVYLEERLFVARRTPESIYYEEISGLEAKVVDLHEILDAHQSEEPAKLLIVAAPNVIDELHQRLGAQMGTGLYVTKSRPQFLEIMKGGIDKGHAIALLARELGVTLDSVMAVGDSLNDLEMLRIAGWAVAVAHAPQVLRDEADYVTVEDDGLGVAEAIERFVLS